MIEVMQPSQEEPRLDQVGLWHAGRKGVMSVGIVKDAMQRWARGGEELMLPGQEEPRLDQVGLWHARWQGMMNVEMM